MLKETHLFSDEYVHSKGVFLSQVSTAEKEFL